MDPKKARQFQLLAEMKGLYAKCGPDEDRTVRILQTGGKVFASVSQAAGGTFEIVIGNKTHTEPDFPKCFDKLCDALDGF